MKRRKLFYLIITLFFITGVKGQTNWSLISQPGENLIIVDQTTGYSYINKSVGSHGMEYTLKKSTDGFQSFATIRTKSGDFGCYSLDEMFYIDADTGFIAELCQGVTSMYKSVDGGQTWTATGYGGTYGLSMYFLNANNGYYAFYPGTGNDSYLMRNGTVIFTTNKYIFTKDNYQYAQHTTKIKFVNDSTGFIICKDTLDNAVVLKTSDFGNNWSEKKVLNNNLFKDIYFISDSIGFVAGTNGYIFKTSDLGDNWQAVTINTSNQLNSIDFSNDSVGYIVGNNGEIWYTQNQGMTWDLESFNNSTDLIYVRLFDNGKVYINDINGNLYSNNANSLISNNSTGSIVIKPNPAKDLVKILLSPEIRNHAINLFNMQGGKILSTSGNTLDLEGLGPGVYIITVESDNESYSTKIIKH